MLFWVFLLLVLPLNKPAKSGLVHSFSNHLTAPVSCPVGLSDIAMLPGLSDHICDTISNRHDGQNYKNKT